MSPTRLPSALRACAGQLVGVEDARGGEGQRDALGAGELVDLGHRLVAEPALGHVDDPFEGEIVGGLDDHAQIGERIADLGALVEAEAADDAVGQADRDEAILELARLELGADEDGDIVEPAAARAGAPRSRRRRGAPPPARPTRR